MSFQEWLYNHPFFPKKKISEVGVKLIQQHLVKIFENMGMPQNIKVDNGRPFGDPLMELISPLALWLTGLGINVIRNRPKQPTDNAVVERSQGVMGRWTEYKKCKDTKDLQSRLLKEANFHNHHFSIRRKGNETRIECYPTMEHTNIKWNPEGFDLKKVLNLIAQGEWERKVASNGQIGFYGQRFSIGIKYKHQIVSIKLDASTNVWNIYNANGNLINTKQSPFTVESIWKLDFS